MALELNNTVVPYKEFYGRNVAQMPKLIADGRVPLNVASLMQQRLHSGKQDWKNSYFDTGDAFVYHPDGRMKVILDSQTLRDITPQSKLNNGALVLEAGVYEGVQGPEFTRKDLATITEKDLSPQDVKAHPIWQALARDKSLLNEYVDAMSAEMKERFSYNTIMGVYLDSPQKTPTLQAAYVDRLVDMSRLYGRFSLDYVGGRFVGVAPEALVVPARH